MDIVEVVEELKINFIVFRLYNNDAAVRCVDICNSLKDGISFDKLHEFNMFFNTFLSSVPTDQYEVHTNFTLLCNELYTISKEKKSFDVKESLELDVNYATNNYYEAHILASLGIPTLSLDYELAGLLPFLKSDDPLILDIEKIELAKKLNVVGVRETLIALAANFFYLSRILGHNYPQAHALYSQSKQYLVIGLYASKEDIDYLCYYGSLLGENFLPGIASDVLSALKTQYSIEYSRNPDQATKIAVVMTSRFAMLSGESIIDWAQKALAVPKAEIKLHIQVQVDLSLTILLNEEVLKKQAILHTLVSVLDYIEENTSDSISNNLQRQRLSNFPIRVISRSIELKDYSFAIICAYLWRTYEKGCKLELAQILEQTLLLGLPLFSSGKSVLIINYNGNSQFIEVNHHLEPENFISIKNEFEGNWTVISGQVTPLQPPSKYGMGPIITKSDYYEEALKQLLYSDSFADILMQVPKSEVIRFLELPGLNLPLPSLFGLHYERIMSTLVVNKPKNITNITRVLIWCDPEGNLFDSYREKEALESLLSKNGIYYESYYFEQCSLGLFLNKYSDMKFDLV